MVFSSPVFLFLFLPVTLGLYFLMPTLRAKNLTLMVMSLFFYAWGEPLWVFLMIGTTFIDYIAGILIVRMRGTRGAKATLITAVVINLGFLAAFKYLNFLVGNINALFGLALPTSSLTLPIGISFYTFQALSYVIDIYRDEVKVQRKFTDFMLFVSLFPQLIAGPILRYKDIAEQITHRTHSAEQIARGAVRLAVGLGKKILIANYCSAAAEKLIGGSAGGVTVVGAWLGILLYAFQIYFDFSGYSDMAIGMGHIMGFNIPENFRYPYTAKSITEFWRRWHISLSTIFRDYVYIPMGGNRKGFKRQVFNMFVVWGLTGLWHGASWNFVVWGLWFFVLLFAEKLIGAERLERIPSALRTAGTFLMVLFGWVFFYFINLGDGIRFFGSMIGVHGAGFINDTARLALINNIPLLLVCVVGSTPLMSNIAKNLRRDSERGNIAAGYYGLPATIFTAAVFILCTTSLLVSTHNPFIYFRF